MDRRNWPYIRGVISFTGPVHQLSDQVGQCQQILDSAERPTRPYHHERVRAGYICPACRQQLNTICSRLSEEDPVLAPRVGVVGKSSNLQASLSAPSALPGGAEEGGQVFRELRMVGRLEGLSCARYDVGGEAGGEGSEGDGGHELTVSTSRRHGERRDSPTAGMSIQPVKTRLKPAACGAGTVRSASELGD